MEFNRIYKFVDTLNSICSIVLMKNGRQSKKKIFHNKLNFAGNTVAVLRNMNIFWDWAKNRGGRFIEMRRFPSFGVAPSTENTSKPHTVCFFNHSFRFQCMNMKLIALSICSAQDMCPFCSDLFYLFIYFQSDRVLLFFYLQWFVFFLRWKFARTGQQRQYTEKKNIKPVIYSCK